MRRRLIIESCCECFPPPLDCGQYYCCMRKSDGNEVIPKGDKIPDWCPLPKTKKYNPEIID